MRLLLAALLLSGLLAGCAGTPFAMGDAQFNSATYPLPANYDVRAAKLIAGLPVQPGQSVALSAPRKIFGTADGDPQRWYVCVRGLKPQPGAPEAPSLIVFGRFGTPALVRTQVDEPCRTATGYRGLPRI